MSNFNFWQLLNADKIGHFCFYSSASLFFLLRHHQKRRVNFVVGVSMFLMGAIIELLQATAVKDRMFDSMDLLANLMGSLFALILFRMYQNQWISVIYSGESKIKK